MKQLLAHASLLVVVFVASMGLGWLLTDAVHQIVLVVSKVTSNI